MSPANLYLQTEQRMVGDIYTSREVMDTLTELCDEYGSRFAGTPGERAAADFIRVTLERYGLENARLESYEYEGWSRGDALLEVLEPIRRSLVCISLPFCPAAEVIGELASAGCGSPAEYEGLGAAMDGRIVSAASSSPPGLGRWVHRKEKYERAVLGGARAFVFVSEHPGVGPETGSLQDGRAGPIPGISISREDGEFLARLQERKGKVRLRLRTTDTNEQRESWNVVAELPGAAKSEETVILGCHYDGHDISQGAVDPASGMAIVLEAARVLARHAGDRVERTVRFIGFGTEELGLTGSRCYVAAHGDELDRVRFMLNLDAAGGARRKGVVLHRWPELEPFFRQAGREMAAEMPVGQKMSAYSDHFPFVLQGVPSGNMGDPEARPAGRGFGHTAYDTLDKVELENLRKGSAVAARLALRIANAARFPASRRDRSERQEILATDPDLEGYRVSLALAARRPERS